MKFDNFEQALMGGHPNSLGNTVEVVEIVLKKPERFDELFNCYFSDDEVVRLRVSNAMKRVEKENSDLVYSYIDRFLGEISQIDQASAQWTLAQLFLSLEKSMSNEQKEKATEIMKRNLENSNDWIVLAQTMPTLGKWSKKDDDLKKWLLPRLEKISKDPRKAVSKKALKTLENLQK